MTHSLISSLARFLGRFAGRDVHIEPAGPAWAFLDFDHVNHGQRSGGKEHEAWGLGLHVIMSPFRAGQWA